jgi:hypothetical protein
MSWRIALFDSLFKSDCKCPLCGGDLRKTCKINWWVDCKSCGFSINEAGTLSIVDDKMTFTLVDSVLYVRETINSQIGNTIFKAEAGGLNTLDDLKTLICDYKQSVLFI